MTRESTSCCLCKWVQCLATVGFTGEVAAFAEAHPLAKTCTSDLQLFFCVLKSPSSFFLLVRNVVGVDEFYVLTSFLWISIKIYIYVVCYVLVCALSPVVCFLCCLARRCVGSGLSRPVWNKPFVRTLVLFHCRAYPSC
jgi:hypothetical protein